MFWALALYLKMMEKRLGEEGEEGERKVGLYFPSKSFQYWKYLVY